MSDLEQPTMAEQTPPADEHVDARAPGAALDADPAEAHRGDAEPRDAATPRRRRLRGAAPWVLLVLALAVAVASTVQWRALAAAEEQREEVERTAATFILALTSWDAAQGMASTRDELRAAGTERFAGEVDELFGTTEDLAGLEEIEARSEGEVRRSFVQELDDDRASALVVASQRLTADVVEGEEISTRYAEVELVLGDEGWLVDDVELLVDVAEQDAQATLPAPGQEEAP